MYISREYALSVDDVNPDVNKPGQTNIHISKAPEEVPPVESFAGA